MRYEFIQAEKANYPIRFMCKVMAVAPSGFYAWRKRGVSEREKEDRKLTVEVCASWRRGRKTYGSPRIHRDLHKQGICISRKRVARLMRRAGIAGSAARPRKHRTTDSRHDYQRYQNTLGRQFDVQQLNDVWAADITYISTARGTLYLAVVMDLCSRKVIGWSLRDHMETSLVLEALLMALQCRPAPRLHHSDQGSQYASDAYQACLRRHGIQASMSRVGDCWDNAVVESFFGTLKCELPGMRHWSAAQARTRLFDYIEVFYNRKRMHSTLDYLSPTEYEMEAAA